MRVKNMFDASLLKKIRILWKKIFWHLTEPYYRKTDPLRFFDLKTTPLIPRALEQKGLLSFGRSVRVLEVGPLWGCAARDLNRRINIKEIVFIELPEQKATLDLWLPELRVPYRVIYTNISFLTPEQTQRIGRFDLIYCTGVIYHVAQQLRLCKILFDFLDDEGMLVLGSYVIPSQDNIVKIYWPNRWERKTLGNHIPSRSALQSWLEMVGFSDVRVHDDMYSKKMRKHRTVLTAKRKTGTSTPAYLCLDPKRENETFTPNEVEYRPLNYIP